MAATPDGPAREEIDRKLFQALADRSTARDAAGDDLPARRREGAFLTDASGRVIVVGPGFVTGGSPRKTDGGVTGEAGSALGKYLGQMEKAARERPTAAAYLRLANWNRWAHRPREAAIAAAQ